MQYQVALPLHPEYRTMPMVWYIPPLSPVVDVVTGSGNDGEDARTLFAGVSAVRPGQVLCFDLDRAINVPLEYSISHASRSYAQDIGDVEVLMAGGSGDGGCAGALASLGGLFFASMAAGAWALRVPPPGWAPEGHTPTAAAPGGT